MLHEHIYIKRKMYTRIGYLLAKLAARVEEAAMIFFIFASKSIVNLNEEDGYGRLVFSLGHII